MIANPEKNGAGETATPNAKLTGLAPEGDKS